MVQLPLFTDLSDLLRRPFQPSSGDGAESPQGKNVCQSARQLGRGREGRETKTTTV